MESLVLEAEHLSPQNPFPENLTPDLRHTLASLTPLQPLPDHSRLRLWKLSFRLWNACVDLSNSSLHSPLPLLSHITLRHIAADSLSLAGKLSGIPSPEFKIASFYLKTGLLYHSLSDHSRAFSCFDLATEAISSIDIELIFDASERRLLLDLSLARSRSAWDSSDRNLGLNLITRAKSLLFGSSSHARVLASQYVSFGRDSLSEGGSSEALRLMSEAMTLCENSPDLTDLRLKCLRFIAAIHLQEGEFQSVLRCVRVLRDTGAGSHPSLPVLATKAWLGLRRYAEAEEELRGMISREGIPEEVWVSAVEAYFEAVGSAGAETVKGVFLGLLGRCGVTTGAALRLVYKVTREGASGDGSRVRAGVVAQLVSDDRVLELFTRQASEKDRTAMHSVLWNCAADHFRSKDYPTSAEMFEKSMLYVPYDIENRIVRAKGFRVLCLCHLGMSQLDRAQEYINEAEKNEPSVATAFLKFKIYLQKKDHSSAINQMQGMPTCLDFTLEYLSLAAHEAVACHALPVAIASLSHLLNFYSSGKALPTMEVVVIRTLVTILSQDPENEPVMLEYIQRAWNRASELGVDCFFGKGEVGRRERNWFAINSWNIGTKSGKDKKYDMCAEFLRLASEFYDVSGDGELERSNVMACKSLILSVSAMLAFEKQMKAPLLDSEVKRAIELLDKAGKILASMSTTKDHAIPIEPNISYIYTFNKYDLYGRLNDTVPQQLVLVKSFAGSKSCNPKDLLNVGLFASDGPRHNPEVATFALNACLASFLASSTPNYENVALIMRKLIAGAVVHKGEMDDDFVHGIYKQAYRIMVGLKESEYPIEEGKWLAMTAWNRAALPVRLGQNDIAKKWMSIGLEIAGKVPGMEIYRECMEGFLASLEEKTQKPRQVNS